MNDNLPALPQLRTSQELVNPVTDSWAEMLPQVAELARAICTTQFVPEALRNNVAGTTAAILYNREIGLPPMTGLNAVHVIKGKVGISAEMMRAKVLEAGHELWFEETNTSYCVISGRRKGSDRVTTVKYSETDAKTAGLFSNDNYQKNPRRMYQARATSELCALIFADVIRGMVSSEELYDDAEAGDSIPVPREGGTTVQRKTRRKASPAALEAATEVPLPGETQTDDGAAPLASPPRAGGMSPAPSSPLPPLPGEEDVPSAAATAESDAEATPGESSSASASTPQPELITAAQIGRLGSAMKLAGITGKEDALDYVLSVIGRDVANRDELTQDEAERVIEQLALLVYSETRHEAEPASKVEQEDRPRMMTRAQQKGMFGTFNELGITDDDDRLRITAAIIGRMPMDGKTGKPSSNGLTAAEYQTLVDALARCKTRDHVEALVQWAEQERAGAGDA